MRLPFQPVYGETLTRLATTVDLSASLGKLIVMVVKGKTGGCLDGTTPRVFGSRTMPSQNGRPDASTT